MSNEKDVKLSVYGADEKDATSSDAASSLLGKVDSLPTANPERIATSLTSAEGVKKIWPGYIIAVWIALSSSVILQNAWILRTLQFNYPIFLTTWHLIYATIGTRLLLRFTHLLDDLQNVQMSWDRWLKNIVPIGALFSGSLIFSNFAYLSLSVSFIQMLKAFTSVAVLVMSVAFGLEQMQPRKFVIVIAISCGVALASYGEIAFDWQGFVCQALGIAFEAARLVCIQKLLTGLKMGPLVSLYYFAPVCAALNLMLIPFFEGAAPFQDALELVGWKVLVGNATTALALNIAVVFLIGCASSLVLTLSGVIKDILLVLGSVVIMGSTVTFTQMIGYAIALGGLVVFKLPKETTDKFLIQARGALGR
ncbi:hypothetical protein BMF94_5593 [Rhodotorula taiwanensis]|uniref:Sugar phosphate transporter domain-containing protein n=1 Tax=Rhodotorula taiwanensis TaxID=741276 RepID=A0A2S5B3L2_9BASI|nr:hypothetical protein BMF94_5593 [Rhodotorula taiwanensis]